MRTCEKEPGNQQQKDSFGDSVPADAVADDDGASRIGMGAAC